MMDKIIKTALLFVSIAVFCASVNASEVVLTVQDGIIECEKFERAQDTLVILFQGVHAKDEQGNDLANAIQVVRVTRVDKRGRYHYIDLEEAAISSGYFQPNEYDYTISNTLKLFQTYFIFKPGWFEIFYTVLDEQGQPIDEYAAKATQYLYIKDTCSGTLGCLSSDSMSGCRESHIPYYVDRPQKRLGEWLPFILCAMVLVTYSRLYYHS